MKRFFLIRIVSLISILTGGSLVSCFAEDAEDSYLQTLQELTKKCSTTSFMQKKDKVVKSFSPILIGMGCPEDLAAQRTAKYFDEVLTKDYMDWLLDIYKPVFTEQDMKEVMAFYSEGAGKIALEHSTIYDSEESQAVLQQKLYPNVLKIAMGQKTENIKSSLPKSYQKMFQEYSKISGLGESINMLIKQAVSLSASQDKDDREYVKAATKYLTDNMGTLMMEAGYPTMTEEDFSTLVNFYKSPVGKKLSKVNATVIKEAVKFSVSAAMKFQMSQKNWAAEENVSVDAPAVEAEPEP